jgi:hypothetical protein
VAPPAGRGEAAGVVLVEVRQEVGLAASAEPVHRHQALLHGSPPPASPNGDAELMLPQFPSPRRPLASASGCCAATLEFLAFALKREEGKKRTGASPVSQIEKFPADVYMAATHSIG